MEACSNSSDGRSWQLRHRDVLLFSLCDEGIVAVILLETILAYKMAVVTLEIMEYNRNECPQASQGSITFNARSTTVFSISVVMLLNFTIAADWLAAAVACLHFSKLGLLLQC